MSEFYSSAPTHLVAVDCIIFGFDEGELKLLLFKRSIAPEKGKWSLMGGFLEQEEDIDQAAERVLHKLTGLSDVYMEQLYTFGDLHRDPGGRIISVAYFSLIKIHDYNRQLKREFGATWFPISEVPDLIFDHNKMVNRALRRLRRKSRTEPLGFELLPEKFTLPQLQSLYEAIHQQPLDKRNFRKKILALGVLIKLEEKDKMTSKKGAYYYKFDYEKYQNLLYGNPDKFINFLKPVT